VRGRRFERDDAAAFTRATRATLNRPENRQNPSIGTQSPTTGAMAPSSKETIAETFFE
jgi:hypothetical protein